MNYPRLLKKENIVLASNLDGMAYVKDRNDCGANATFYTRSVINTKDNTTKVDYEVSLFKSSSPDYFQKRYTNYSKAISKYNELIKQFNAH